MRLVYDSEKIERYYAAEDAMPENTSALRKRLILDAAIAEGIAQDLHDAAEILTRAAEQEQDDQEDREDR